MKSFKEYLLEAGGNRMVAGINFTQIDDSRKLIRALKQHKEFIDLEPTKSGSVNVRDKKGDRLASFPAGRIGPKHALTVLSIIQNHLLDQPNYVPKKEERAGISAGRRSEMPRGGWEYSGGEAEDQPEQSEQPEQRNPDLQARIQRYQDIIQQAQGRRKFGSALIQRVIRKRDELKNRNITEALFNQNNIFGKIENRLSKFIPSNLFNKNTLYGKIEDRIRSIGTPSFQDVPKKDVRKKIVKKPKRNNNVRSI